MAEVFGVVASGIGIAGVAAQAIDGIRKLQAFCNDIRDAPEEIKYLTTELEILLGTIANIETQIQRNSTLCGNMDPTPALRFVDQSVRSLNAVIEKLNAEIVQKRRMGSMKMAWRKKVLESHLMKIERSKTSLSLAVTAYSTELYLQTATRTDTKIDQLSMDVTTLAVHRQTRVVPSSNPQDNDALQVGSSQQLGINNDDHWKSIRKRSRSSNMTPILAFSLALPSWLAQQSLKISLSRAAQDWTLNLRSYRTISIDENIWDTIRDGDFDGMRNLIDSGQATVFDRIDNGLTLLHYVGIYASTCDQGTYLRMARFLVDRGADVNETMYDGTLAIHGFCFAHIFNTLGLLNDMQDDEILRILGDEDNLDVDLLWQAFRGTFARACSSTHERKLRCRFSLDTLEYPTITLVDRLRDIRYDFSLSPRELVGYLGIESFEVVFPILDDDSKRELLRGALHHWGSCSGKRDVASEEWEHIVRGLFALGARFELLGRPEEKEETPEGAKGGIVRDEAVAEDLSSTTILETLLKGSNTSSRRQSTLASGLGQVRLAEGLSFASTIELSSQLTLSMRNMMALTDHMTSAYITTMICRPGQCGTRRMKHTVASFGT
ncbi:hypothetical protein KCV07_g253, partial [Aureobasidium melanogenum]